MNKRTLNLQGKKFGKLTVIKRIENKYGHRVAWLCKCDCGNETTTITSSLVRGLTTSCGCWRKNANKTHGLTKSPVYNSFMMMHERCYNPSEKSYHNYGGRGIKICKEWRNNITAFHKWAMVNGYKKGLQIDRIDNDGNYEPSNCRWVTHRQQCNNKRNNHFIEHNGELLTIAQWARKLNIQYTTLYRWLGKNNWDLSSLTPTQKGE